MATKSRKHKELVAALISARDLAHTIEMANIPRSCWESAAAGWLCVNRDPDCWAVVNLNGKDQDFQYDLRFGREAKEAVK